MLPPPTHDSFKAKLSRLNGSGWCLRCGYGWAHWGPGPGREAYSIEYSNDGRVGRAMFPLCVECWADLDVEQRAGYCKRLIDSWRGGDHAATAAEYDRMWESVKQAILVEAGMSPSDGNMSE